MNKYRILFISVLMLINLATNAQVKWYNPIEDAGKLVHGRAWGEEIGKRYNRLPERAKDKVREHVWNISLENAGLSLVFYTNANFIQVKYTVNGGHAMSHMPATGVSGVDLYATDCEGNQFWSRGEHSFGDTIRYNFNNLTYENSHQAGNEFR